MPATPAPVAAVAAADPVATTAAVEPKIHGLETQALLDKQAAKKAILAETTAKLKAVDAGEVAVAVKPAPKPRAKKVVADATDTIPATEKPAPKPRAPRKTKKADEA